MEGRYRTEASEMDKTFFPSEQTELRAVYHNGELKICVFKFMQH